MAATDLLFILPLDFRRAALLLLAGAILRHAMRRCRDQLAILGGVTLIERAALFGMAGNISVALGLQGLFQGRDLTFARPLAVRVHCSGFMRPGTLK